MERKLSLVLDDRGLVSLTLFRADNITMDEYTTKHFESSEEIREKYKTEIDEFLKKNENYLNAIRNKSKKAFNGRIVLLQVDSNNITEVIEKRVLYKKHLIAFKELCKDRLTMQEFSKLNKIECNKYKLKSLITPHVQRYINHNGTFDIKTRVKEMTSEIKRNENDFYEVLRLMISAYNIQRQDRKHLPTIDRIYKDYLKEKEQSKNKEKIVEQPVVKTETIETKDTFNIDGTYYKQEEQELFDLDDIKYLDTDLNFDGLDKDESNIR